AGLRQHFFLPISREMFLGLGCISPSARSIQTILQKPEGGYIVNLMPGGAAEAAYALPGKYKLVLKNRKGFVKISLQTCTPLVPVITFGENDVFDRVQGQILIKFQKIIKKYCGIWPVVPRGRGLFQYSFGIIPRQKQLTTVGKIV